MKKLFAIAVLGLVLVSCKKSSSPGSSIQATINDTAHNFTVLTNGSVYDAGSYIRIGGVDGTNGATANQISFVIRSNQAIVPGVYTDTANYVSLPTVENFVSITYGPVLQPIVAPFNYGTAGLAKSPVTVTVTSVSQTNIQGTFEGTIYLGADSSYHQNKVITNGKFNVALTFVD